MPPLSKTDSPRIRQGALAFLSLALLAVVLRLPNVPRELDGPRARAIVSVYAINPMSADSIARWPLDTLVARLLAIDPYAALLDGDERENMFALQQGGIAGVGILLHFSQGQALIDQVLPGGPAAAAGLRAGDQLIAVASRPVSPENLDSLVHWIRGPIGTTVDLALRRENADTVRSLVRQSIALPLVTHATMLEDSVGYLRLDQFAHGAADAVSDSLYALLYRGARSLVLDLRGNGGGLMEEGLEMAALWIPRGRPLAYLGRKQEEPREFTDSTTTIFEALSIAVLVDENTASAAEIVAGALREEAGAMLIGDRPTYGKGVVQEVFPLPSGRLLRLTTATWLLPDQSALQPLGPPLPQHGTGLHPTHLASRAPRPDSLPESVTWREMLKWSSRPAGDKALADEESRALAALDPATRTPLAHLLREMVAVRSPDTETRRLATLGDPQIQKALRLLRQRIS